MKKSIGAVALTAFVAVLGASRAQAQVVEPLKFTTTFSFMAGQTTFPAGTYTVRPLGDGTDVVEISNANGSSTKFVIVEAAGVKDPYRTPDEVIFKKQGDTYVLSQIWDAAEREGVQTMPVKGQEPHPNRHQA
jgi:hypothetical protein